MKRLSFALKCFWKILKGKSFQNTYNYNYCVDGFLTDDLEFKSTNFSKVGNKIIYKDCLREFLIGEFDNSDVAYEVLYALKTGKFTDDVTMHDSNCTEWEPVVIAF